MALKPNPVSEVPKAQEAPEAPVEAPAVDPAADPEQAAREASKTGAHEVVLPMSGITVGVRTF